jgi:HTH-type transcriptional regulator / antitoxin HipB
VFQSTRTSFFPIGKKSAERRPEEPNIPDREELWLTGLAQYRIFPIGKMVVDSPTSLGVLVRERREELGLSQVELAGLAGVGPRLVSEIEGGKATAQIGKVFRLLHRLDLVVSVTPKHP